ncbi:hypothetical protein ACFVS9_02670 [Streptomyces sp. NPDC058008]|uniref:hypothetical protein n=1 Tax=Streptomyces sp. NPDC058008 TaxID=3346303 RepID=UPI0036EADFBD
MPRTSTPPRRHRALRAAAVLAAAAALACYPAVRFLSGLQGPPRCSVGGSGGATYELSPEQAGNAATVAAVGTARGLPERAVAIALATALQESSLRNLGHGDRDSLGLFQQRPSQGWGTPARIMDPVYASGKFYEHLAEVPDYARLPLTVAAQQVQRSAFPRAYAKHETGASLLAAALTGRSPASLTCSRAATGTGAPGDAAEVRSDLARSFGTGVLPPAGPAGASASGTVSLPVRGEGDAASRRGWELAHWAVARAGTLRIEEVSYAGRVWTAGTGWRTEHKESDTTTVRMRLAQ